MRNRFFKNQSGFTLIEIMVSTGLLAIVALIVLSQTRMVSNIKREAAEDAIINALVDRVNIELSSSEVCSSTNNFGGKSIPVVNNPTIITVLKDRNGADLLSFPPTKYGNKNMSSIDVSYVGISDMRMVFSTNANQFLFEVTFLKTSIINGVKALNRPVTVQFPLIYVADKLDPTKVKTCFNDYTNAMASAVRLSCKGNNSVYYNAYQRPPYGECESKTTPLDCGQGKFITTFKLNDPPDSDNSLKTGCGALAQSCPSGQVITGFNNNGTPQCGYVFEACADGQLQIKDPLGSGRFKCTSGTCGLRQAIRGWDSAGNIKCSDYIGYQTCSTYVTATSAGGVTCYPGYVKTVTCGPGQFIQKIDSTTKQPVCANYINLGVSCPAGQGATGFDSNGNITCAPLKRRLSCNGSYSPAGKTFDDCVAAGGSVMNRDGGTNSFCRFAGASCPAGYSQCSNWGNSSGTVSCTDTNSACSYSVQTRSMSGANVFTDPVTNSQRTAQCYYWARNSGPWVMSCTQYTGPSNTTLITERGCY